MARYFYNSSEFHSVHVKGEVSGVFISKINHLYFDLKDKNSEIPCVVFRDNRKDIPFEIENGMKLLVIANVGVYWRKGKYQLDVRSATEDGLGQLFVKLQQLKRKLAKEGLFDDEHKKELPRFVKRIGVITSQGGSVIHDVIRTVEHNWPYCQVFIFPAAVQGTNSKDELIRQITRADNSNLDVLIVARGGGNLQDLWSYNEEEVVRCIFNASTPVITAIGHEDNTTLSDLVADRRASTPTMAASLAVEDKDNVLDNISHLHSRLISFMSLKMEDYKKQLNHMLSRPLFIDKTHVYYSKKAEFEGLHNRFHSTSRELIISNRVRLNNVTNEYVIRHPCKIQIDLSKSCLIELENRLIDAMHLILNKNRFDVDRLTNNFKFLSQKMVDSKRHEVEMSKSYLITNPCQKRIDTSRNNLNLIEEKLVSQANICLDNGRRDFELASSNFQNCSRDLINSNRGMLDRLTNEYVIRNPCKIQFDTLRGNLNDFQKGLNNAFDSILSKKKINHERLADEFEAASRNVLMLKRHDFEIAKSNFSATLYQNRIDSSRNSLNLVEDKLVNLVNVNVEDNKRDLDLLKNRFKNQSKDLVLKNSHELDSIKGSRIIKNPQRLYESKSGKLKMIKNEKVIRNPYLILDSHQRELDIYREKLDKIKQVIELKEEQQKQKRRYMIAIVAIVIFMIMILVMLGGIL